MMFKYFCFISIFFVFSCKNEIKTCEEFSKNNLEYADIYNDSLIVITKKSYTVQKSYCDIYKELKTNLESIKNYNYFDEKYSDLDIDSLCETSAKYLTEILVSDSAEYFDISDLAIETICSENENNLKIHKFSYNCGGTAGNIYNSVLICQNKNKKKIGIYGKLFSDIEFISVNKLKSEKDIILLIGYNQYWSQCFGNVLFVFEILNDGININYPAFDYQSKFFFDLVNLAFNEEKQIIYDINDELLVNVVNFNCYNTIPDFPFSFRNKLLEELHTTKNSGSFVLKFNGTKFEIQYTDSLKPKNDFNEDY